MPKNLSTASAALGVGLAFLMTSSVALAQSARPLQAPAGSIRSDIDPTAFPQLAINILFAIATFLTVVYMMYGGIKWITSRGDRIAVESARKHIAAAVVGLIVVAGTFFFLQVLFRVLGAENPIDKGFSLPTIEDVEKKNSTRE